MSKGNLFIVTGPSGAGKGTVLSRLLPAMERLHCSVSATTRQPRPGEQDGVNYYFLAKPAFEEMIRRNEFLEYAEYVGNYYGTSLKVIREQLEQGIDVLLDIEVQGAAKVKERCPEAVLIFLIPPSIEELSRRLHRRNTDAEEVIGRRLQKAREECRESVHYDYLVVNDTVVSAAGEILSILEAERCRTVKRLHLTQSIVGG